MPSSFSSFTNGDMLEATHVSEMHVPIQNIERGTAFYAGTSTGTSTAYAVAMSPAPEDPHPVGMIVNFKVHTDNIAGSPDVTLDVNSVGVKPILKAGGDSLAAGDLKAGQMASVVYDSASGGAFKLIAGAGSSVGSSVAGLDDLTDVAIGSPSSGQVVRYNGSNFANANLSATDMPSGIDAANIGSGAVSNTEFGYLDGVTGALQAQLEGKASNSHTHAASDITSSQIALARGGTAADLSLTGPGLLVQETPGAPVTLRSAGYATMWGTGADGAASLSSGTTTLTENANYTELTISGTANLVPGNNAIFVSGTLNLDNAPANAVNNTGNNGGNGDAVGNGGYNGVAADGGDILPKGANGPAGGAGQTGTGSNANAAGANAGFGGEGGGTTAAGNGASGSGGAGGAGLALSARAYPTWISPVFRGDFSGGGRSGRPGSGGGGDGTHSGGGGGGGGAASAPIIIFARRISRGAGTAEGAISTMGGNGGTGGTPATGNCGGGAGSGGGGGGWIYIVYEELLGSAKSGLIKSTGGTGGGGGAPAGTTTNGGGGGGGGGGAGGIVLINALTGDVTTVKTNTAAITGIPKSGNTPGGTTAGAVNSVTF